MSSVSRRLERLEEGNEILPHVQVGHAYEGHLRSGYLGGRGLKKFKEIGLGPDEITSFHRRRVGIAWQRAGVAAKDTEQRRADNISIALTGVTRAAVQPKRRSAGCDRGCIGRCEAEETEQTKYDGKYA